ncbi:MAG: hypothetical protein BECKG1743D_GA0114223_101922 [Candidatus Kentron sp. G]|nr:MAG: hypothetical protein BECKG1743E_GA0114224_101773 [Candidatus Kentron sp. G]VFN00416.1 MAG: hypothetical protein BECKG1743D_GA0114223_101922 [Candidatus Kentron sp. G]
MAIFPPNHSQLARNYLTGICGQYKQIHGPIYRFRSRFILSPTDS